jgi:hypothetical protein
MNLIKLDINDFNNFLDRTDAVYKAENEIIEDKLKHGINGLEWLIMQVILDEDAKESLAKCLKLLPKVAKDPLQVFGDAVRSDPDTFYDKHELNWWIMLDEALTYFALLKERDYDTYFDVLQEIYKGGHQ